MKEKALLGIACMILFVYSLDAQNANYDVLKRCEFNSGWRYKCEDVVHAVNHYRQLGKQQSIETLRGHLKSPEADPRKVILFCRLLFVNTNGWELPQLGQPTPMPYNLNSADTGLTDPNQDQRLRKDFSTFPFALSEHVPFMLIEGYSSGGTIESAEAVVSQCERLELLASDLSSTNYEAAVQSLSESRLFHTLYPNPLRHERMTGMLLQQAERKKD